MISPASGRSTVAFEEFGTMPPMPAESSPWRIARSSAMAMVVAASLTGCQSESPEPRATSSMAWRVTVNGARSCLASSSISAQAGRVMGATPGSGQSLHHLLDSQIRHRLTTDRISAAEISTIRAGFDAKARTESATSYTGRQASGGSERP